MSCLQSVPEESKNIYVKAFNKITNKNKAEAMTEHISCDCKCKFDSITCNSNQKWNNKTCQCECKNYHKHEKDYSWGGIIKHVSVNVKIIISMKKIIVGILAYAFMRIVST